MRNEKDGIALAAIVAKETTTGEWSGMGGGLGLGTGGIGVFVGGMGGTKFEQTQRAKDFEGPKDAKYSLKNVYGPILSLGIGGVLIGVAAQFTSFMAEDSPSTLDGPYAILPEMVNILGYAAPLLAIFGAAIWFIFFSRGRQENEMKRLKREEALIKIRKEIYYRLRYVENDHIVFDPKTGREVPAEQSYIVKLINDLATQK
ncbi:TPA: hypothetical protein J8E98_004905 [Escherichia coli]|uniref:hypothetical protein n=1 Tax=Enterobacterales TaxID=91347 RepID=UPI00122E6213|nr:MULTISPECIES: hypothetical protein [Enterobacterales]EHJ2538604.1 hypothetical protein [Salmonella enterica]KAA1861598.1 hypothetical protein EA188_28810 [Escherichia coli]KAA1882023.1 hypothetical protein EA191_24090 [Escherichia coli]MCX2137886.1 hypothetical protein [Escherichia coli]MCX2156998.1 hypothetical protein [Escherichia coli]